MIAAIIGIAIIIGVGAYDSIIGPIVGQVKSDLSSTSNVGAPLTTDLSTVEADTKSSIQQKANSIITNSMKITSGNVKQYQDMATGQIVTVQPGQVDQYATNPSYRYLGLNKIGAPTVSASDAYAQAVAGALSSVPASVQAIYYAYHQGQPVTVAQYQILAGYGLYP